MEEPNIVFLTEALNEHLTVLATTPSMSGYAFTGRQALLPETDLPDAYRVWSETVQNTWVWIDTDGCIIETRNPMFYVPGVIP
jgi:hypothetical protein